MIFFYVSGHYSFLGKRFGASRLVAPKRPQLGVRPDVVKHLVHVLGGMVAEDSILHEVSALNNPASRAAL